MCKTQITVRAALPLRRGGAALVASSLVGVLVLAGCAEDQNAADDEDNRFVQEAEQTMTSDNETTEEAAGSGGGLLDVEGGYTQDEQMAELETVVEVMREHFGEDVATIEGEPWTAERHDAEVTPRPRGDDVFRHRVSFNVAPEDLEETYATAEEIAEQLGLSGNAGNSQGITQYDEIFYGAGREERRTFVMTGESAESFRAAYQTRHSDHESMREASERVGEKNRQERDGEFGPDNPRQLEDIEGYEEDQEDGASD